MNAATVIPCKRPKVTADPIPSGLFRHTCHVPGCGWTFVSVKSAQEPAWHRADHRRAVPDTELTPVPDGVDATCSCGEKWTAPTRAHGRTWLRHHLELDHGLVSC